MSNKELELSADQLIITKSDPTGKIIYCNQDFIELSGYSERELIGQPHSLLRHKEMPAGIFYLLWHTLKQKKEFNGFIQSRCKNGDSYWAFTNISPVYSLNNQLLGYTGAQRQPNPAATTLFSMYYEQMLEEEGSNPTEQDAKKSLQLLTDLVSATGDDYEASVFKLQFS
jgi:aerotaxis receptor